MFRTTSLMLLCAHMLSGGKVVVKDKHDHTVKESTITAVYANFTVKLADTVLTDYDIAHVTLIPL